MIRAVVLAILLAFSSASNARSDWYVPNLLELDQSDQVMNHKPPLSSQELLAVRKATAADVSECSKEPVFENQHGETLFRGLRVRRIAIGADKTEALVIQGWGGCMCGATGNCTFRLLEVSQSGYHVLLSAKGIQTFAILDSGAAGYYDIVTGAHDSASDTYLAKYHFDGERYRKYGCAELSYQGDRFDRLKTPRIIPEPCK
jgi:hypothetical protein